MHIAGGFRCIMSGEIPTRRSMRFLKKQVLHLTPTRWLPPRVLSFHLKNLLMTIGSPLTIMNSSPPTQTSHTIRQRCCKLFFLNIKQSAFQVDCARRTEIERLIKFLSVELTAVNDYFGCRSPITIYNRYRRNR